MTDRASDKSSAAPRRAFSLLELIVTIAVVGVLMALTAPAIIDIISGSRLTGSGDFVYNKLIQARQRAITESRDVRVRIYAEKDDFNDKSDEKFRSLQFLGWDENGIDEILTDIFSLEEGISISRRPELSSLVAGLPLTEPSGNLPSSRNLGSFIEFSFHPDGSTNLPLATSPEATDATDAENTWFLTIVPDTVALATTASAPGADTQLEPDELPESGEAFASKRGEGHRPQNFYCIQIDPDTGGLSVYRP